MSDPDFEWIDRPERMAEVAAAIEQAPWTALDTESNSMFVYRERVCLMQINAGGRKFVIDPLALAPGAEALAALKPALEDPARPLYLHGGEYDVGCLRRDYGVQLRGVWDSQQAASLLGWERTGYGAAVEKLCGVVLGKDFAQYDWATRPIAPEALRYAVDDVVYLPQVCDQLREAIAAADLVEELAIANQVVEASPWSGGFDPAGFWKIKGVRDLPAKALPLLAALYAWRDQLAQRANQPPGRMLNNESLLAVCRFAPTSFPALKRCDMRSWFLTAHGEELIAAIKAGLSQPPTYPDPPRAREVSDAEHEREPRLKDWRKSEAQRRALPLQAVLPAKALEHLKRYGADDLAAVPQLGPKRIAMYGDKLRELCR